MVDTTKYKCIMKICHSCEVEKPITDFYRRKTCKDGHVNNCKRCLFKRNKEKRALFYLENKERLLKKQTDYYNYHREERKHYQKDRRKKFPELVRAVDKKRYYADVEKSRWYARKQYNKDIEKRRRIKREWYQENREKVLLGDKRYKSSPEGKAVRNARQREKLKNDVKFRLNNRIRARIHEVLKSKGKRKAFSTLKYLSAPSFDFLKKYLEARFKPGMTWENNTVHGWHIDHIIPCSSFDFNDVEQQKKCWHYTNLQPLWAHENLKKKDKIIGVSHG